MLVDNFDTIHLLVGKYDSALRFFLDNVKAQYGVYFGTHHMMRLFMAKGRLSGGSRCDWRYRNPLGFDAFMGEKNRFGNVTLVKVVQILALLMIMAAIDNNYH